MASVTIGLAVLLLLLGVGGYFGSGRVSKTALIPAFFGVPILALGLAALRADWHDYALYGYDLHATALHLLGIDHERLTFRHNGSDRRLTDVHGRVLREILA